jgi:hypothetical protein
VLDTDLLLKGIGEVFPRLRCDIRASFRSHWGIEDFDRLCDCSKILDIDLPFERQPERGDEQFSIYDGYVLQDSLRSFVSEEREIEHLHVIVTDLLTCTFDEDSWRYHARPIICGTPSILSLTGIVEGPAKPKEYYMPLLDAPVARVGDFSSRFIDQNDERLSKAVLGYLIQSVFYFVTEGEPFCGDQSCTLFNSHWQEDLIRTQVEKPAFCSIHLSMLNNFNRTKVTG